MKKIIFLSILLTASLSSCFRKYNCPAGEISIILNGYDSLSVDTIITKRYTSQSNYSDCLSTDTIIVQNLEKWENQNENNYYLLNRIHIDSDWEIITNNNNYKINGFTINQKTIRKTATGCNEKNCTSPCSQYYLNNNIQSIDLNQQIIYLDK